MARGFGLRPAPDGLSEDEFRHVRAEHLAAAYEVLEDCEHELREQAAALAKFAIMRGSAVVRA